MKKTRATGVSNPPEVALSRVQLKQGQARPPVPNSRATPFTDAVGWVMIFCATFLAYFPAFKGTLLWDDSGYLTGPGLRSLHGLWLIWSRPGATVQYYPLLHSAFWLEHRIWGDAVAGYHLINIALHAFSACLVVLIVRRLSLPRAWLAGFVFALHPVNVETVAWIAEQKNTLCGVFCLASLLSYLHFDQTRRKSHYVLATGLFVLALLSKTVTATLPAVLLVICWWQRGQLAWKRDVKPLLSWFALSASAGLVSAWVEQKFIGAQGAAFLLTPAQRVLIAGRAVFFYLGKLVWPVDLTSFYPHWKLDPTEWWQWLFPAGIVMLGVGLGFAARRYRGPLASLLIFCGTLFPILGFLNVYFFRYSYVADHFQYLACLAIIVPVTSMLARAGNWLSPGKTATGAFSVAVILVVGVLTWRQSRTYRDAETFYRESLQRNPSTWVAHYNRGILLADMPGRLPDAIVEYRAALRITAGADILDPDPRYVTVHNNLGIALSRMPGRLEDSIAEYQAALKIGPDVVETHCNLGNALSRIPDRFPEAIAQYQAALRVKPDYAEAHYNLGFVLAQMPGRLPDAIAEYELAVHFNPNDAKPHLNLGSALLRVPGRLQDAIAEYQAALRITPNDADAHLNLGSALLRNPGRLPEAIAEYQAAVHIRPDYAEAHYNLGNAWLQAPDHLSDAIAEYRAALGIRADYAEAHFSLGNAWLRMPDRVSDAIAEYHATLRIKPDYGDAHYNLAIALAHIPGRTQEATAEYQAALKMKQGKDPKEPR